MALHDLEEHEVPERQVARLQPVAPKPFVFVNVFVNNNGAFRFNTQSVVNDGWAWTSPTNTTTGL